MKLIKKNKKTRMSPVFVIKKAFIMAFFLGAILILTIWSNTRITPVVRPVIHVTAITDGTIEKIEISVHNKMCFVNYHDGRSHLENKTDLKMIYYVTPTYPRPEQVPELTRLAHTLMHVPRIHWIVADDQPICSEQVSSILRRTGMPYTHFSSPKPYKFTTPIFPRGVSNRRAALKWLQENVDEGILYFGDDDNTVDLELFEEIRNTKKVSMFPVGLIGEFGVSTPIVKNGKVIGFFDSWPASRKFPVDMAGFAVNLEFLSPAAAMPYIAGHEEDRFLLSLDLKMEDIEPLAENCSKILVWHTKTVKFKKSTLKLNMEKCEKLTKYQSFVKLLKHAQVLGMTGINRTHGTKPFVVHDSKTFDLFDALN